jgi:hypothetical protein
MRTDLVNNYSLVKVGRLELRPSELDMPKKIRRVLQ